MGCCSSPPAQSAGPTQSTVVNTNIPDYAQPYVSNMLNAAQAQIFQPDMTTFNQYVPYSNNPQDYVASFSPLQQQAQSSAANLQTPGQYAPATGAAALGTGQALTAGAQYANQATDPNATQAYMNPYLNAALQPQLQEINRQYDITGTQEQSQATNAGAFGGSREALMAAENERNKNIAMNQAIGTGYNNAFQAAQQAQQFGANLGMQGAQTGIQGAGQLAGIGGQELAAQQGIIGTQAQQGGIEQQNQQNVINQAVQNYATAQQYPFLQLGLMNSMLRGLPMQSSTTQMYQAPPSQISQIAGLGTAGLGAAAMYGQATKKDGGMIKMAPGGIVPMNMYTDTQLQQVPQSPASTPMANMYAQGLQHERAYNRSNPQAAPMMRQALPVEQLAAQNAPQQGGGLPNPQQMPQRAGLAGAPTGPMTQMAGGGILAFAEEGEVPAAKTPVTKPPKDDDYTAEIFKRIHASDQGPDPFTQTKSQLADIRQEMTDRRAQTNAEALTRFGLGMMSGQSQYPLVNVGAAGEGALGYLSKARGEEASDRKVLAQNIREMEAAKYGKDVSMTDALIRAQGMIDARKISAQNVGATREDAKTRADRLDYDKAQGNFNDLFNKQMATLSAMNKPTNQTLYKRYKDNPQLMQIDAHNAALQELGPSYAKILGKTPLDVNTITTPSATPVIQLN